MIIRNKFSIIEQLADLEIDSINRRIPIIGREKGIWLLEQIKRLKPQKILELGTANGYSGCILGSQGAELTTVEINEMIASEAVINFKKYNIKAAVIIGDGVTIAKQLAQTQPESFDLLFIDFYKNGYLRVWGDAVQLIKAGGIIISDNLAFTQLQVFKRIILNDSRLNTKIISGFKSALLNERDEISFSIKK